MRQRSGILAAFIGISAIVYQTGSAKQGPKPGATETSTVKPSGGEEQATDWDLLRNLTEFYGCEVPRPERTITDSKVRVQDASSFTLEADFTANTKKPAVASEVWRACLHDQFDWIIATIPDPELSAMRLDFDREINAIQNAIESGGYHFDRYFFPWTLQSLESHSSNGSNRTELDSKRNLPGMLLFRASNRELRNLVVFLVGETPTSGIVPGQFKNAIRFGKLLRDEDSIRIAGPHFSGSFDSLIRLTDPQEDYEIRTWTSDLTSQRRFNSERPHGHLAATTDSSSYKINRFCLYVREKWHEPKSSPIVLLIEESTAFGAGAIKAIPALGSPEQKRLGLIYVIKFPRGISKLRNATEEKHRIPGFEEPKGADALRKELPFTLKEERVGGSDLPFYSAEQSPVSQEAMLLSIASLTRKGALHYAGIVASDSLDLLFLSRFLHSAAPNTRLFTIGSDLLFEHGADGSDFQGILAVTNYPLFAFNQIWTRSVKDSTIQVFPNDTSESVYNATVQLLAGADDQKSYREYGDPFHDDFDKQCNSKPPLWITVASRNGYAPVAPIAADKPNQEKDNLKLSSEFFKSVRVDQEYLHGVQGKVPQWAPEYWESWGYLFACIWLFCLLYAVIVLLARPTGNRLFAIFSVKPEEDRPIPRAHFLFLLGLCLSVLIALWLAVPYIIFTRNASFIDPHSTDEWRHNLLLLVISGVSLVLCFGLFVRRNPEQQPALIQWCGVGLAAMLAYLLVVHGEKLFPAHHATWTSILFSGAFIVTVAAAPASTVLAGRPSAQAYHFWFSRVWLAILSLALIATVSMAAMLCLPPASIPIDNSPSLIRLWALLHGGAIVLGIIIAASAVPIIDAIHGMRYVQAAEPNRWARFIPSNIYFWFSVSAGTLAAAALLWTGFKIHGDNVVPERFLAACRSINLTSGVSPLMPLTIFTLALAVWCFVQLRRISYHEDRCPSLPKLPDDVFCPELQQVVADVEKRIAREFFHPGYNAVLGFVLLMAVWVFMMHQHQTVETPEMDRIMLALALLVGVSLVSVCMRFVLIWSAFREFLLQLERHPVREIFGYLPRGFLWIPIWQGGGSKRTHVTITRSLECIFALIYHPEISMQLRQSLKLRLPQLKRSIKQLLISTAARKRVPAPFYKSIQNRLSDVAVEAAAELEQSKWLYGSYEARLELSNREITREALHIDKDKFNLEEPYTICSELLALRFVPFINYVLLQLQNLAMYLSVGFLLLLTAMNCYIFRARTVIDWLLAALFLLLGSAIVTVFSQLDKDAIFSRITRTAEGKLDRNFLLQIISYGAVPALALLASHVPSIAKFFFSWIKPAMDAIH